jgi:hypothetical protein
LHGEFADLVNATGEGASSLIAMAKKAHEAKQKKTKTT